MPHTTKNPESYLPADHLIIFEANKHGKDFIVGDIHGHFEALEALLRRVNFNAQTDRVFVTGDVIDRGPYSHQVINWLSLPWFYTVLGNHEKMIIDAVYGQGDSARHSRNGGAWFYQLAIEEQHQIAGRLQSLPIAIELQLQSGKTVGIVHAEPPGWEAGLSWRQGIEQLQSNEEHQRKTALTQALYGRSRISCKEPMNIEGIDAVYVGHTTVAEVTHLGNVIYTDTGCSFSDGRLTLIDTATETQYST